jgi:hypothetical protein
MMIHPPLNSNNRADIAAHVSVIPNAPSIIAVHFRCHLRQPKAEPKRMCHQRRRPWSLPARIENDPARAWKPAEQCLMMAGWHRSRWHVRHGAVRFGRASKVRRARAE